MLYLAGAFVAVAVALGIGNLLWLTPGAGQLVGVSLIGAIVCLCINGLWSLMHHRRHAHPMTRH